MSANRRGFLVGRVPELTASTRELSAWSADRTRTYAEAMDAWQSSCPRLTVWEDVLDDGLVQVIRDRGATGQASVAPTARGRAAFGAR